MTKPGAVRVFRGFVAMSAGSIVVMLVQLGYAAASSRILEPPAFGAYAVALAGVGLLSVLAGASLELSAARRDEDTADVDRALLGAGASLGIVAMAFGVLVAPAWAQLWAVPDSTTLTRLMCLGLPVVAVQSVYNGVLRRQGLTTRVAAANVTGQLVGIGVGLAAVVSARAPWSLTIGFLVAGATTILVTARRVPSDRRFPLFSPRHARKDINYAVRASGMNLLRMSSQNISGWSISRFAGTDALGAYNRATSLITAPLTALQASFNYALFPELRPDGPVSRNQSAFTEIMILISWPVIVAGGIGYFAAPPFLELLLGPGWSEAVSLAGIAVLLGVMPMIGVPLGTAFEALGRFRVTVIGWIIATICTLLGALVTFQQHTPLPAAVGLLAGRVLSSMWYVFPLARADLLAPRQWWSGVRLVLLFQAVACGLVFLPISLLPLSSLAELALLAAAAAAEVALLWLLRSRTTFWRLLSTRGLTRG